MTQLDLTGPMLRDAALKRSAQGRQERIEAVRAQLFNDRVWTNARRGDPLTADDVWDAAEALGYTEGDTRYLGNVLKGWDLVQPTEQFVPSRRKSRHAAPVRVWRWA